MDDKLELLESHGFSAEYLKQLKEYIENNEFENVEQYGDDNDEDKSVKAKNIIIQKVEQQHSVFLIGK